MEKVFLGLGTNLGDRRQNLKNAVSNIISNNIKVLRMSSVIETDPVDFLEQPCFLNQILIAETSLEPCILLDKLKAIEKDMGRKKVIEKGPRLIDIDILLYGQEIIDKQNLKIPHPAIKNRDFILFHLNELNSKLEDPVTNEKYSEFYSGTKYNIYD